MLINGVSAWKSKMVHEIFVRNKGFRETVTKIAKETKRKEAYIRTEFRRYLHAAIRGERPEFHYMDKLIERNAEILPNVDISARSKQPIMPEEPTIAHEGTTRTVHNELSSRVEQILGEHEQHVQIRMGELKYRGDILTSKITECRTLQQSLEQFIAQEFTKYVISKSTGELKDVANTVRQGILSDNRIGDTFERAVHLLESEGITIGKESK